MARMIPQLLFRAAVGVALLLACTSSAHADENQREARVLYQKGNAAFKKGDTILARDYYQKSLALHESFDTVCNLGRAQAQDKLHVLAYESLVWCSHLYPEDNELADARIKFIRLRDEMRTEISPAEQHEVDERVATELERRRQMAKESPAQVESAPAEKSIVAPSVPQPVTYKKRSRAALPVSLSIGGLGVVGLGVGTGFLVDSLGKKSDADDLRTGLQDEERVCTGASEDERCQQLSGKIEKRDMAANVSTVSFIAGGALVAAAVVTYWIWPKTRSVTMAGLHWHRPQPVVSYQRDLGEWQFGWSAQF